MKATHLAWLTLFASACSGDAATPIEAPPPDPCVALRAEIESIHARVPCSDASECELAGGVFGPEVDWRSVAEDRRAGRYGLGGVPIAGPCGSAVHRESSRELADALSRFTAAGCGPVGPPGSRDCVTTSHGPRLDCVQHRCVFGY